MALFNSRVAETPGSGELIKKYLSAFSSTPWISPSP